MLGILLGILLVPYLHITGIQIILGLGLIILFFTVYLTLRIYLVKQSELLKTSIDEKKTEMGFVVNTFHDLVGKLKEKEKELERLMVCAEERALRIETYNENILQSVPSGVVSIDNSMRIKSINLAAERTLGIRADDVIDKDYSGIFDEPLSEIVRDNKKLYRGEYSYVTKDGRHIWLGVTTSQLKNAAKEIIGLILVFTDLTDIKTLQSQVELKKRLTQLGEMSAGIAHELRNPMSVISGYMKLLDKRVGSAEKGTVNAVLAEIENMNRIISEFLAFAKPTDLNKTPVNLKQMIKETVAAAAGDNKKVKITITGDNPESIMSDEFLLRQAFTNIFINAFEAMPEGGNLDIGLSCSNDKAVINIKDTGQGIPGDIKQKIFLPFFTSKQNGIGLGLAIVQKIIVSHGGSIYVESKEGAGATFRITLPVM